jgi:CHAT domain-containing protein
LKRFAALLLAAAAQAFAAEPLDQARELAARAAEDQALGFRHRAIVGLEEALALVRDRPDSRAFVAALRATLGQAYLRAGRLDGAGEQLEAALKIARADKLVPVAAGALNDLGRLRAVEDKPEEAQKAYAEALKLARDVQSPLVFAAAAGNIATPQVLQEAESLLKNLSNRESDFARIRLAEAWGTRSTERSHALLRAAYDSAERRRDLLAVSWAAGHLGALYAGANRDAEAMALTRRAVFAAQEARADESLYRWSWQSARLMAKSGDREAALAAYRRSLSSLAAVRQDLILELRASRQSWRDTVGPLFLETADHLLRREPGETLPQERLLEARALVEQLKAVELEDYFQDECVAGQLARQKDIGNIEPRTAVLYPIVLPDRLEMLIGAGGTLRQATLPVTAQALTADVHEFRRRLEKRTTNQYLPYARRLYASLIQPLEPLLAEIRAETIVFIPDGPLRGVPVAALHDGKGFLVERFAFATAPGLTLVEPQSLGEKKELQVMLSGITESVQNFPPLPFVGDELTELQAIFAGQSVMVDREFRVASFEQRLRATPYSIVHIASHGQFEGDPKKSFLLAYDGRLSMDGLEGVMKLARFRDDPVELLTLSACRTAAGDDRAALGIAGVAVKAGARSALATLWYVNDQASSQLVTDFYRQLRQPGASKAKALAAAQRAVIADERFRHPGYWAPFLLIGNWL